MFRADMQTERQVQVRICACMFFFIALMRRLSRDDSERLSSYAGEIFNLPRRCHEQYQHLIQTETQKESLLRQLYLLEINSNPFYNEENFEVGLYSCNL